MTPAFFRDDEAPIQPDQYMGEFGALLNLCYGAKRVLEIGAREGGTLYQWLRLVGAGGEVAVIDLPSGRWGTEEPIDRDAWYGWAQDAGANLYVHLGDSHGDEAVEWAKRLGPFDVVFIDGDHSAPGVARDLTMYGPLVRRGGLLALHDVVPDESDAGIGVWAVWRQIARDHTTVTLLSHPTQTSRGIGVIWR